MLPILLLSTITLTSAVPFIPRSAENPSLSAASSSDPGCIPRPSASLGFRLVVNVTDPSKDFPQSINGQFLSSAHIGPAQNRAVISASSSEARTFYQNGTYQDIAFHRIGILSDSGSPPGIFPEAITYQRLGDGEGGDAFGQGVYLNAGQPGSGTSLTRLWDPYSYLTILEGVVSSAFVVCNKTIPYYGDSRWFNVVNWVQATRDASGTTVKVPEGCVPVNLVPECVSLPELPEGAYSSHEHAMEVRCYENVGAIDWSRYPY